MASWKTKFRPGQPVTVDGVDFMVAHIGQRSLVLRPPFKPMPKPKLPSREDWLKGGG